MKNAENHAEEQAKAQLEGIVEMVAALTATPKADAEETADAAMDAAQEERDNFDCGLSDSEEDALIMEAEADRLQAIADAMDSDDDTQEKARETIQEDALSVEVRGDWHEPGSDDNTPAEYMILLCTGGPAVRIIGDLDAHQEPDRACLQYQDWGTGWTEYFAGEHSDDLLEYARCFYFGA